MLPEPVIRKTKACSPDRCAGLAPAPLPRRGPAGEPAPGHHVAGEHVPDRGPGCPGTARNGRPEDPRSRNRKAMAARCSAPPRYPARHLCRPAFAISAGVPRDRSAPPGGEVRTAPPLDAIPDTPPGLRPASSPCSQAVSCPFLAAWPSASVRMPRRDLPPALGPRGLLLPSSTRKSTPGSISRLWRAPPVSIHRRPARFRSRCRPRGERLPPPVSRYAPGWRCDGGSGRSGQ